MLIFICKVKTGRTILLQLCSFKIKAWELICVLYVHILLCYLYTYILVCYMYTYILVCTMYTYILVCYMYV